MACTECPTMAAESSFLLCSAVVLTALSKACSAFTLRVESSLLDGGNEGTMVLLQEGEVFTH